MVMEAMRLIRRHRLVPRRTIRRALFMNEEMGQSGSKAYFAAHRYERHVAAIECDLGATAPRGFATTLRDAARSALEKRLRPLAKVAPVRLFEECDTSVDTRPLVGRSRNVARERAPEPRYQRELARDAVPGHCHSHRRASREARGHRSVAVAALLALAPAVEWRAADQTSVE